MAKAQILGILLLENALLASPSFSKTLTRETGAPVGDNQNSKTAGPGGGVLLEDAHLLEKLARFDRMRIPERVVHARGVGAYGVFKSYGDFHLFPHGPLLRRSSSTSPLSKNTLKPYL